MYMHILMLRSLILDKAAALQVGPTCKVCSTVVYIEQFSIKHCHMHCCALQIIFTPRAGLVAFLNVLLEITSKFETEVQLLPVLLPCSVASCQSLYSNSITLQGFLD